MQHTLIHEGLATEGFLTSRTVRHIYYSGLEISYVFRNHINSGCTMSEKVGKIHFSRTMHYLLQRLTSMFFEKFSSAGSLKGTPSEEKISKKNIDFSL